MKWRFLINLPGALTPVLPSSLPSRILFTNNKSIMLNFYSRTPPFFISWSSSLSFSPGRFLLILQAPAQVEPSRWNLLWLFRHLATVSSPVTTPILLCGHWVSSEDSLSFLVRNCLTLFVASLPGPWETFNKYLLWTFIKLCGCECFQHALPHLFQTPATLRLPRVTCDALGEMESLMF